MKRLPQTSEVSAVVTVRKFVPTDAEAFRTLNEEWIRRYFSLESRDSQQLNDPARSIIQQGGEIFIAEEDGVPIGCCALIRTGDGEYELAKMAVTSASQGKGVGRTILKAAIDYARSIGANRLHLGSNSKLGPAVHLYESFGFRHMSPERLPDAHYERVDVWMELDL